MGKTIFLDVDGTLCNNAGQVPTSAHKAIARARENGHQVYLCTGRSLPEITPEVLSVGIDGIIGAGGGYVSHGDTVLLHKTMPQEHVLKALAFFKQNNVGFYLESNTGIYASDNCRAVIEALIRKGANKEQAEKEIKELDWFFNLTKTEQEAEQIYHDINKISFISIDTPFSAFEKELGAYFTVNRSTIPQMGENSGELSIGGCNKKTAIEILQKKVGFATQDTIAFGDGYNDIDMFHAVGYTVAMADAPEELKALANYVTQSPDENGIYNGFEKLGLL